MTAAVPLTRTQDWLAARAAERAEAGLHRVLRPRPGGVGSLLDLASNDYLGLARHPVVVEAAVEAARRYGAGSTGSRLVTGTTVLHEDLERALATHLGAAEALVFSSGYLANLGVVTALAGPDTLIVSDQFNHASLIDACRLSRAEVAVVAHRDPGAVERALVGRRQERALVLTESVFSVGGDPAPLAELYPVVRRHGAVLVVDEAHSLGVVGPSGRGSVEAAGLAGAADLVVTVTLSKSLGSQGGAVLGGPGLREHLIDSARAFIFDTALAPPSAGAALAALGLIEPARVSALHAAVAGLAGGLGLPLGAGALVRVPVGDPQQAVAAQQACADAGVLVGCFRPPSVPPGQSCLRLTARADLGPGDLDRGVTAVRAATGRS